MGLKKIGLLLVAVVAIVYFVNPSMIGSNNPLQELDQKYLKDSVLPTTENIQAYEQALKNFSGSTEQVQVRLTGVELVKALQLVNQKTVLIDLQSSECRTQVVNAQQAIDTAIGKAVNLSSETSRLLAKETNEFVSELKATTLGIQGRLETQKQSLENYCE
ncbi:MAG: hypothetical protein Q7S92_04570 [Candidatus Diapherotrites archaeon]|nr:hypothetical protein [Candidatus Diapherotrites archaeon]